MDEFEDFGSSNPETNTGCLRVGNKTLDQWQSIKCICSGPSCNFHCNAAEPCEDGGSNTTDTQFCMADCKSRNGLESKSTTTSITDVPTSNAKHEELSIIMAIAMATINFNNF